MKRELLALTGVLFFLVAFPGMLFGYQAWRTGEPGVRVVDLVGYAPAQGGWKPETVRVRLGERVRLRVASADVVHGLAVPSLGIGIPEVLPGHVEEIEFVADRVGRFPFTCTRWCSTDHWRMRGAIEVVGPANPDASATGPVAPPLFQKLKLDLDAPREPVPVPPTSPSAQQGASLGVPLPQELRDRDWFRTHSAYEAFSLLRSDPSLSGRSDDDAWNLVALAWQQSLAPQALARGRELYARDCAACHGQLGRGDGPAGRSLPGLAAMGQGMRRGPADFGDAGAMLGASDVLLQGKVLRGGMGTGMPEWGSLYSDEDLWAVVSYLRSFVFEREVTRDE